MLDFKVEKNLLCNRINEAILQWVLSSDVILCYSWASFAKCWTVGRGCKIHKSLDLLTGFFFSFRSLCLLLKLRSEVLKPSRLFPQLIHSQARSKTTSLCNFRMQLRDRSSCCSGLCIASVLEAGCISCLPLKSKTTLSQFLFRSKMTVHGTQKVRHQLGFQSPSLDDFPWSWANFYQLSWDRYLLQFPHWKRQTIQTKFSTFLCARENTIADNLSVTWKCAKREMSVSRTWKGSNE